MKIKSIALSGLMGSGKDYLAELLGYTCWGFADPMYELAEYFHGTRDKAKPGMRQFLQEIGQWGWGCVNDLYPLTSVRAITTASIRRHGKSMTKNFTEVDWTRYGTEGFWVNILRDRVHKLRNEESTGSARTPLLIAVTNVRFTPEYEGIKNAGFSHFLIACTEETRRERLAAKGVILKPAQDNDTSEQFARQLVHELPDERIVWNDRRPMPDGKHYRTPYDLELLLRHGLATVTSERELMQRKDGELVVGGSEIYRKVNQS